ncbi:MAG: substrate-binding domain-containing protein [Opitutaceae bacterium]|nr:substrate-binding domain-containing protein [Opitutaceae bacterium]
MNELKAKLIAHIRDGFHRPGDPFLSNRALVRRHGVSYQTAHRLLGELQQEGWLARRESSGTAIAGRTEPPVAVQLIFDPRARRPGSFGASLLQRLRRALTEVGIPFAQSWADSDARFKPRHLPVLWEAPKHLDAIAAERRFVLLLQDRPPPGLGASYIDSVRTDDFSGGMCAVQVLLQRLGAKARLAILAGPPDDRRSQQRVEGFLRLASRAQVCSAGGWYSEDGEAAAPRLLEGKPDGVFCCNDRLAEGLLAECARRGGTVPAIIGFDNAPISEALHLTTIAIPWDQFVSEVVTLIRQRLKGDPSPARQIILSLRPHIRLTA